MASGINGLHDSSLLSHDDSFPRHYPRRQYSSFPAQIINVRSRSSSDKGNFVAAAAAVLLRSPPEPQANYHTNYYESRRHSHSHHPHAELRGSNDWEGLLDPLHPLLADEIVRYGEFANACYKAFDLDPASNGYLNCKHRRSTILDDVGLGSSGYHVTRYVYATPGIVIPTQPRCSRWIGYFAVSDDATSYRLGRRDITVAFRGTVTPTEWVANFMSALTPARLGSHKKNTNARHDIKVESGFLNLYTSGDSDEFSCGSSCRRQLLTEISRLIKLYENENVSITLAGHSMGSSLALLFAYDLAELGLNRDRASSADEGKVPITVYSFAGPRVGNIAFKERCHELGVKVLRVVNVNDPITKLPGVLFNENFSVFAQKYKLPWSLCCYAHVGTEVALDFFSMDDPACVHDLGSYLRLLRGSSREKKITQQGKGETGKFFMPQKINNTWTWQDAAINVGSLLQSKKLDMI